MGLMDKVKDKMHSDKGGNENSSSSEHKHGVSSEVFTQSGPGSATGQGGAGTHGSLGSGADTTPGSGEPDIGGKAHTADETASTGLESSRNYGDQANSGGPPGLQDFLGQNAASEGGLAAQAAGGPGAPGQPGQVGGGKGSSGPTYSAQQGDIGGPQQGPGSEQGPGVGGQQGGMFGQPGSAKQGNQGF